MLENTRRNNVFIISGGISMTSINYKLGLVVLIAVILLVVVVPVSAAVLTTSQFGALAQNASGYVDGNPIGGGKGYSDIKTSGNCTATNSTELISCLGSVTSGQVVYVPGTAEINMTDVSPTLLDTTTIPAGVTIASNRGYGGSAGGRIFKLGETSDNGYRMFTTGGNNVRITGLRIEADHPTHDAYVKEKEAIVNGFAGFQIDNCEISGWSVAAIEINSLNTTLLANALTTSELGSSMANIHHNYIHNNQATGYGYGVVLDKGVALIKANVFSLNGHSIADTGASSDGYEATYNIEFDLMHVYGHTFDVHGQIGGESGIAGNTFRYYHNTFYPQGDRKNIMIRGDPLNTAEISYNILANSTISACSGPSTLYGCSVYQNGATTVNITMARNYIDGRYVAGSEVSHV